MQKLSLMDDDIQLCAILERPNSAPCPLVIVLHGFTSSKDRAHDRCRLRGHAGGGLRNPAL